MLKITTYKENLHLNVKLSTCAQHFNSASSCMFLKEKLMLCKKTNMDGSCKVKANTDNQRRNVCALMLPAVPGCSFFCIDFYYFCCIIIMEKWQMLVITTTYLLIGLVIYFTWSLHCILHINTNIFFFNQLNPSIF